MVAIMGKASGKPYKHDQHFAHRPPGIPGTTPLRAAIAIAVAKVPWKLIMEKRRIS